MLKRFHMHSNLNKKINSKTYSEKYVSVNILLNSKTEEKKVNMN